MLTPQQAIEATIAELELSGPQFDFCETDAKYPAFVGGLGSGKTFAGTSRVVAKKLQYPEQNVAYYLPTYDLVRQIGYPRISEYLTNLGIPYRLNESKHEFLINEAEWGKIIFRTMDSPDRIIGYEVADSVADELDTLPIDKARTVWQKMIARNRQKKPDGSKNTIGVVTTPEGFRFTYERWVEKLIKKPNPDYQLFHSPTSVNAGNLPEGYIDTLLDDYPENLRAAYLEGKFVNITAGSVYPSFDRRLNASQVTMNEKEPLHIGLDFNVTKMAAAIHVIRGNDIPHAVGELVNVYDTPAMIKLIKERYQDLGHPIIIYPDATGKARDSNNATESDLTLLRAANFLVCVNSSNPRVRDRIVSVNVKLKKDQVREYFVNIALCPHLVQGLEKQAYDKNGEPDKSTGVDHIIDAAGYFVVYRYPILKRVIWTHSHEV